MHHGSARLTVHGRLTLGRRVIEEGWTVARASWAAGVSRQTGSKWWGATASWRRGPGTARPGPLEPSTGLPILTDNGTPYCPGAFAAGLAEHGITYKRTRPYTLRTNGKAEAMVGHLLRGWAYRRP